MDERLTIRMTAAEKQALQQKREEIGLSSDADFARKLIAIGLRNVKLEQTDSHLISNTTQTLFLLRKIVQMLSVSEEDANDAIATERDKAHQWTQDYIDRLLGEIQ